MQEFHFHFLGKIWTKLNHFFLNLTFVSKFTRCLLTVSVSVIFLYVCNLAVIKQILLCVHRDNFFFHTTIYMHLKIFPIPCEFTHEKCKYHQWQHSKLPRSSAWVVHHDIVFFYKSHENIKWQTVQILIIRVARMCYWRSRRQKHLEN